jgi:hypothetical protein
MLLDGSYEIGISSLEGIGKVCKGNDLESSTPKGTTGWAVSLKRYADRKPEISHSLPKQAACAEITNES